MTEAKLKHSQAAKHHAGYISTSISIAYLNRAEDVLNALRQLGLEASIYEPVGHPIREHTDEDAEHQAIWIGYRVAPNIAIMAIQAVIKIWPHLRYLHLSGDAYLSGEDPDPPGFVHHQLFFCGSTEAAVETFGLSPWTVDEINAIPDQAKANITKFHEIVRRKYGRQALQ